MKAKTDKRTVYLLNTVPDRGDFLNATHALGLHNLSIYCAGDRKISRNTSFIIDLAKTCEKTGATANRIIAAKPEILGCTCFTWNLQSTLKICRAVRKALPEVKIVLGGPGAEAATVPGIPSFVDTVVSGEGEIVFHRILTGTSAFEPFMRGETLEPCASSHSFYTPRNCRGLSGEVILKTGAGCDYHCSFCSNTLLRKKTAHPQRGEKDIICLLKHVVNKPGTYIYLIEPCIDSRLPRFKNILRIAASHNKNRIPLAAHMKLRELDDELISLMEAARCTLLRIDLLSTNARALKSLGAPPPTLETIRRLSTYKSSFDISLDIATGLPGDNYEGVKKTLGFAAGLGILNINSFRMCVIPGTPFAESTARHKMYYDHEYPYLLRSTPGFSEEEMNRADLLVNSFKTVARFITPSFNEYLGSECGFDIVQFSEDIIERFPAWRRCFKPLSEGGSELRISPRAADYIGRFLRVTIKNRERSRVASEFIDVSKKHFLRNYRPPQPD